MGSFTTDSTMRVTFFFVAVLAFFSIGSALRYNGGANCDSRNHEVMAEVPGCMKHSDFPSCGNHRGNTCSSSYTIKTCRCQTGYYYNSNRKCVTERQCRGRG